MRTLVLDPVPAEFEALLERRRRLGIDRFDEVWEGVLHMVPAPHSAHGKLDRRVARLLDAPAQAAGLEASGPVNIGRPEDYRVLMRLPLTPTRARRGQLVSRGLVLRPSPSGRRLDSPSADLAGLAVVGL